METLAEPPGLARWGRGRDVVGLIVGWGTWAALTIALFVYVRQYSRNIPYCDEFAMVSVMTGTEPVSLRWAWAQHNEHRPMVSRLIMAGLFRLIENDFRVVRYANTALLSAMAAAMLILARRLRGSAHPTDVVLPLSILNFAQAESLMIGFAMNLILTSLLAVALIGASALSRRGRGTALAIGFGLSLVLLPLCGGSGLTMLPPLAAWLAGYVAVGWWSGQKPAPTARAIGAAMIVASVAVALLYLRGYSRPPHHPLPPSMGAVASSTLVYLSLAVYPQVSSYWWPAGPISLAVVVATLLMLAIAGWRTPAERPRALAMIAVILSMIAVALAVGFSRTGLGPEAILASRYVTLTIPMLCALYVAWLVYGRGPARLAVHLGLAALLVLTFPAGRRFSRDYGSHVRGVELRVERCLLNHAPTATLMSRACPAILADPQAACECFRMLKQARVGAFVQYQDDRIATAPEAAVPSRR